MDDYLVCVRGVNVFADVRAESEDRARAIAWDAELRPGEKVKYRQELEYLGERDEGPETELVEIVEAY